MKTNQKIVKEAYLAPVTEVFSQFEESNLMAASPAVQPGGGGGGSINVIPANEDDEDTEITG